MNISKCEQECEQMLKMKPQHRKQGNREHVLYVQCAVCIKLYMYAVLNSVTSKPRMRTKNTKEHDCYQKFALREVASEDYRYYIDLN